METTVRSSRARLVSLLAAVVAVHAGVILTSEREGPGSAQLRLGASGSLVSPEGLLVVALLAALAFACAALLFGTRAALARAPNAAGPSRRAFLLSAGGGAASLALAWSLRGRAGGGDAPAVPTAVANAAAPTAATSAAAVGALPVDAVAGAATAAADAVVPAAPANVASTSAIATTAPTAAPPPTATTAASPTAAPSPASAAAPTAVSPPIAAAAAAPAAADYADDPPASPAAPPPRPAAAAPPATTVPPAAAAVAAPKATAPSKAAVRQPTQTMAGGRNNYSPNAPLVPNLGKGFLVAGTVLDTSGEPVGNTRIQIWLNTARGGEREPSNRGSVMTDALGKYRLETSPVAPVFGQPHVHIGYDDGKFGTLFLRPVLKSERDTSITVDFVLGASSAA